MKKYLPQINFILIVIIGICVYLLYQKDEQNFTADKINSNQKKSLKGIAKVVDGDTIKIYNYRVRLLGIDAPETKQKCFDSNNKEYFCGKMATNFLKKIADGKIVECFYDKKDVYNRYLGNCYLGKIFLNLEMVANGMAVIYNHKKAGRQFIEAREEARNNKVGIWQGSFELPKLYRKRTK